MITISITQKEQWYKIKPLLLTSPASLLHFIRDVRFITVHLSLRLFGAQRFYFKKIKIFQETTKDFASFNSCVYHMDIAFVK